MVARGVAAATAVAIIATIERPSPFARQRARRRVGLARLAGAAADDGATRFFGDVVLSGGGGAVHPARTDDDAVGRLGLGGARGRSVVRGRGAGACLVRRGSTKTHGGLSKPVSKVG